MLNPKAIAIIIDAVKTLLVAFGGLWVGYLFYLKREKFAKVEFTLDVSVIDKTANQLFIEFIANLENKGHVRHYIKVKTFILKIRYITDDDIDKVSNCTVLKDRNDDEFEFFSLNFPRALKPDFDSEQVIRWIPKRWKYIFVDGATKQRISLPLVVPIAAKYLLVKSEFRYKDKRSGLHSAQAVFNVDKLLGDRLAAHGQVAE